MSIRTAQRIVAAVAIVLFALLFAVDAEGFLTPEAELLNHENYVRGSVGLSWLTPDPTLETYAERWAEQLAATRVLQHSDIAELLERGWVVVGENVGVGPVREVFVAWYESESHLRNLADPRFTVVGIGVVGEWIVMVFGGWL